MELQNGYITIYLLSSPDGQRGKEGDGGREKGKGRKVILEHYPLDCSNLLVYYHL